MKLIIKKTILVISVAINIICIIMIIFTFLPNLYISSANDIMTKEKERNGYHRYDSPTSKNECHICNEKANDLLSLYWGENNVGIIDLNTFDLLKIDINRYDDEKNLIEKRADPLQTNSKLFQSGDIFVFRLNPNRGYAVGQITISDKGILLLDRLEAFLCSDHLTDFMNDYFFDEEHWDIGLINFKDRTIKPLQQSNTGFSSGDFYIWQRNFDEEISRIELIVPFCPVRYMDSE